MKGNDNGTQPPLACRAYGTVIYWVSIVAAAICTLAPVVALAFPARNVLNPYFLYSAIWKGQKAEAVWGTGGGSFPGGHFWLRSLTDGDGIIQFGLVLGCLSGGLALIAAAIAYLKEKPRSYGWAFACLAISTLIALAAVGVYQQGG